MQFLAKALTLKTPVWSGLLTYICMRHQLSVTTHSHPLDFPDAVCTSVCMALPVVVCVMITNNAVIGVTLVMLLTKVIRTKVIRRVVCNIIEFDAATRSQLPVSY
jgi:hypothetical protein